MDSVPTLEVLGHDDPARQKPLQLLGEQLSRFHRYTTCADYQELITLLWDGPDRLLGGLLGATHSGWLYVEFIWVDESARHRGHGTRLLSAAEAAAVARGCRRAYLEAVGPPAVAFFRGRGFSVCGELTEFTPGQSRYWLQKVLVAAAGGKGEGDRKAQGAA
jgi:ribosomal protein S18 acetylase RimI-like enzyme